jgi:hypothetical protein
VIIGLTLPVLVVVVIIEFLGPADGPARRMLTKARGLLTGRAWMCASSAMRLPSRTACSCLKPRPVWSVDVLDDLDEFVGAVAVLAGVVDEFAGLLKDGAAFGGTGDGDAAAAAEFEESFVAEQPEGAQHGVGVDVEDGGEVFGGWQAFTGFGFTVGDGAADFGGDLFVEVGGVVFVDLDIQHGDSNTSIILLEGECCDCHRPAAAAAVAWAE